MFILCLGSASCLALEEGEYSIAEGLKVTDAVKPGLVQHPLYATMDDLGHLFVIDGPAQPPKKKQLQKSKPYSIKLLSDVDKDGVFDQSITFVDELVYPGGMQWVYDSLYVMSPPGLWYFEDSNGDGKAEVKQTLIDGFDFTGQGSDFSGPFLHSNGRLYWGHGKAKHEFDESKGEAARVWSSDINGKEIRMHAGGGMLTVGELGFTETGEIIGATKFSAKDDALVHWLYGGVYLNNDTNEFDRTGPLLTELRAYQSGSGGVCRYKTGMLNEQWRNHWLVAHSKSNIVSRSVIENQGSGYKHRETENLLEVTRKGSRITDVVEAHNGDLLVTDAGQQGGIYRISKSNQEYQPVELLGLEQWREMDPIDVAEKLGSENPFIRERAITELAIRGHSAIPEMRVILEEDDQASPELKRNAIWTLARLKSTESPELIEKVLQDSDPSVQIAACIAIAATRSWRQVAQTQNNDIRLELERNKTISGILSRLVSGGSPEVARNAATTLGSMAEKRALPSLLERIERGENDRGLQHALIYAMKEMESPKELLHQLDLGNSHQQNAALWALNGMPNDQLSPLNIILLLDQDDPVLNETVNEIVKSHPEWAETIANQFYFFSDDLTKVRKQRILTLAPHFASSKPMQSFVEYLKRSDSAELKKLAKQLAEHF